VNGYSSPVVPRGCLAFLAAAAGAAAAAGLAFGLFGLIFGFVIAALHVLFLAAPLYWWIEYYRRPSPGVVLLASALIGTLPALIILKPGSEWADITGALLLCGLCGVCGGLAFWLVLRPDRQ